VALGADPRRRGSGHRRSPLRRRRDAQHDGHARDGRGGVQREEREARDAREHGAAPVTRTNVRSGKVTRLDRTA